MTILSFSLAVNMNLYYPKIPEMKMVFIDSDLLKKKGRMSCLTSLLRTACCCRAAYFGTSQDALLDAQREQVSGPGFARYPRMTSTSLVHASLPLQLRLRRISGPLFD